MRHGKFGMINKKFWQGKKVFLTGHTGFKGSWLSIWLNQLGANVKGYSMEAPTDPSLFNVAKIENIVESVIGDVRDYAYLKENIDSFLPDIVIHMAAQPLVRYSYIEPIETYETNIMGTVNLLEASKNCASIKAVVVITTDKCYENNEWIWAYRENEPMGGHDPYSSSKGCAELIVSSYRNSFFNQKGIGLASARAGNVVGGGDWAQDRLIPDILRAFERNKPVQIRSPKAIRPWQHVLEPLAGYLILAEKLFKNNAKYGEAWNFGPNEIDSKSVSAILDLMVDFWGKASWGVDENFNHPHEANFLKLDISKAKNFLNWSPIWSIEQSLEKIVFWHKAWLRGDDMLIHCQQEIKEFSSNLKYEN